MKLKEEQERYDSLLFEAEALLWDNAPQSRKIIVHNFAQAYNHAWAFVEEAAFYPLAVIRAKALEQQHDGLPGGIFYPHCEYQYLRHEELPGYSHMTGTGRTEVFIPFERDIALKLVISRPFGARMESLFDEFGNIISVDVTSTEWYSRHEAAWRKAYHACFPFVEKIPPFPVEYQPDQQ